MNFAEDYTVHYKDSSGTIQIADDNTQDTPSTPNLASNDDLQIPLGLRNRKTSIPTYGAQGMLQNAAPVAYHPVVTQLMVNEATRISGESAFTSHWRNSFVMGALMFTALIFTSVVGIKQALAILFVQCPLLSGWNVYTFYLRVCLYNKTTKSSETAWGYIALATLWTLTLVLINVALIVEVF